MKRRDLLGLLTATSALAITGTAVAQSERASAIAAAAYLTMASQGGQFLEEGARIGFEKVSDPQLKSFSRAEVVEQVGLADKLERTSVREGLETAGAPDLPGAPQRPGGLLGGIVSAPLAVAGGVLGAAGNVVGGIAGGPGMTTPGQKAEMISQLQSLPPGPQFDATFVRYQLMGHQEARRIHGDYAREGGDPLLRRIARGALPLIDRHIAFLTRQTARVGS